MGVNGKLDVIDIIVKKRLQWYGHVKSENTKTNCGIDTTGEKEMRTSKKNEDGRSTSGHDNKKFRTRSMEKQRGRAFGFRKTATAVLIPGTQIDRNSAQYIAYLNSCKSFWTQKTLTLGSDVPESPLHQWTIPFLPSTELGVFWAWMFATENKRITRCSSIILQDAVPTHWKGLRIYTPLILQRVQSCEIDHVTRVLATIAHHISY